jgi:hypothetical protein
MLGINMWVHPYSVRTVQVLGGFWGFWGRPEPVIVKMSLLRLQQVSDCIPHPYWMYTKCFGTLICCCCVWAYGSILTLLRLCRSGVDFGFLGVDLSPSDVVMSWLRLEQVSDWIPHPYWMYEKCFDTLISCVWAYGTTLTLLRLCRSRVDFGFLRG